MSVYTKLACFAGGALFGSFGIKLLSSKGIVEARTPRKPMSMSRPPACG